MTKAFGVTEADADAAETAGFAQFNGGPHLLVEIPDGWSTISCRTSQGKLVTFAFCPYRKDSPPQCVDIQHANPAHGATVRNGDRKLPQQEFLAFTVGRDVCRFTTGDAAADLNAKPTLLTLLIRDPEKNEE